MLVDTVQVQHQRSQSSVVGIWKLIDGSMHLVTSKEIIWDACRIDERRVMRARQKRIGQLAKKLLQKIGGIVDIMMESLWIAEIHVESISIKLRFEILHLKGISRHPINAFVVETK